jgi:hypothetical protein
VQGPGNRKGRTREEGEEGGRRTKSKRKGRLEELGHHGTGRGLVTLFSLFLAGAFDLEQPRERVGPLLIHNSGKVHPAADHLASVGIHLVACPVDANGRSIVAQADNQLAERACEAGLDPCPHLPAAPLALADRVEVLLDVPELGVARGDIATVGAWVRA